MLATHCAHAGLAAQTKGGSSRAVRNRCDDAQGVLAFNTAQLDKVTAAPVAPLLPPCAAAAGAVAYGLLSILLFTPLLGVLAVQLPLQPAALALGLGVFCAMPTALSSGVTFTQVRCNSSVLVGSSARTIVDAFLLDHAVAAPLSLPRCCSKWAATCRWR